MLRSPIYAVVGAVILVLAVGAVALYGIGEEGVQQARTPPAVLDKLRLTHHQVSHRSGREGERRAGRHRDRWDGDRGERRRNRGDRGERRRDRWNRDMAQPAPSTGDQYGESTQTAPDSAAQNAEQTAPGGGAYADRGDRRGRRADRGDRSDRRGERGGRRRGGGAVNAVWEDAGGNRVGLSNFRGRFVVLNLWATWCAPCITELPALARAQKALMNDNVVVLAVDLEKQDGAKVAEFLRAHGAEGLVPYIDKNLTLMRTFNAYALPLTILYDKNGREFGRASGPQQWDHPDAIAYLKEMSGVDVMAGNDRDRRDRGDRHGRGVRGLSRLWRWFGH